MSKTIIITNQKGGVGKSTLTANLALTLNSSASVVIVDLDHQGSLISLLGSSNDITVLGAETSIETINDLFFDFILIDTPPYLFRDMAQLAALSDLVIIPTRAGILDAIAIQQTLGILKVIECPKKLFIVLNMVKANTNLTNDVYRELKKHNVAIAKTRISDLVDFTRSVMHKGLTTRKAQYQIDALTKEILIKLL